MVSKTRVRRQSEEAGETGTPTATFSTATVPFNSGVHIQFPNGEVRNFNKLELTEFLTVASQNQIRDFDLYSGDEKITAKNFPLTSGDYKIVPVNKAGA